MSDTTRRKPRKTPKLLLLEIKRTNYAKKGPKMYSTLVRLLDGSYVSSNCYLGFFGRGSVFTVRVSLADASHRMPKTFSVFAQTILMNIGIQKLPYKPTVLEIETAYSVYINEVIADL